ncbi:MAG: hypothetical protein ACRDRL_20175 [Sciscionella sp.]
MPEVKKLVDPLTKQVYSTTEDGLVEVYDPATGKRGRFTETGEWKSGDLRYANRQLAGWMGRLAARRAAAKE